MPKISKNVEQAPAQGIISSKSKATENYDKLRNPEDQANKASKNQGTMNVLPNQKIQTNRGDIKTHNSKDGSLKKEGSLESNNLFDMTGELHEIVTQEIEQNKSETAVRHRKDTKKYNHAITAQQEINQQKNVSSNLRQQINHQVDEIY